MRTGSGRGHQGGIEADTRGARTHEPEGVTGELMGVTGEEGFGGARAGATMRESCRLVEAWRSGRGKLARTSFLPSFLCMKKLFSENPVNQMYKVPRVPLVSQTLLLPLHL